MAESPQAASGQIVPVQKADDSTAAPSSLNPATTPESIPNSQRRPRGKIGRLSKADRDRLNFMLRDGLSYPDVIQQLGDPGKNLTPRNVGDWFNGAAYQNWLKDQEWIEETRMNQESALDLGDDFDAGKFNQSVLQVAITQLFQAFRHLGSTPMKDKLGGDPHQFARLVHALSRACRETLNLQKHREASTKAAASQLKNLNPDRDLSDNEYALLVNKMDQVFKVARPQRPELIVTNQKSQSEEAPTKTCHVPRPNQPNPQHHPKPNNENFTRQPSCITGPS